MLRKLINITGLPNEQGQGLIEYALIMALVAGIGIGGLIILGPGVSETYDDVLEAVQGENPAANDAVSIVFTDITVTVVDANSTGIPDLSVYPYDDQDQQVGEAGITDSKGTVHFQLDGGNYRFLTFYQLNQYWSPSIVWPKEGRAEINTGRRPVVVKVTGADGSGIPDVKVLGFDDEDQYLQLESRTNVDGLVQFDLADGNYKFRADFQGNDYWSDPMTTPDVTEATVNIGLRPFYVSVVDAKGNGTPGVPVYAFRGQGDKNYTGVTAQTDATGIATFNLAAGDFRFRADYQSGKYWSDPVNNPETDNTVMTIGNRLVTVNVVNEAGTGAARRTVYVYRDNGTYTGVMGKTGAQGSVEFDLAPGSYKFRTDDREQRRYWSGVVDSTATTEASIFISGNLLANGDFETPALKGRRRWGIFQAGRNDLGWQIEWVGPRTNRSPGLELQRNVFGWKSASGSQHTELDSTRSVRISQAIPTEIGAEYTLIYYWSPRPRYNDNKLDVTLNGNSIGNHTGAGGRNTTWTKESYTFVANSDSTTVAFAETATPNGRGMFVDNISLVRVSAPTASQ